METPGTILKREREARGLSMRDISSITRIPMRSLQHLEDDRYDMFPAEVFTRGFLRNYARELHLNCDDLLLAYNALRNQRGAVSSRAADMLPSILQPSPAQPQAARRTKKSAPSFPAALPPAASATGRLPFSRAPEGSNASPHSVSAVDNQRTFRFAYLIVILVVAGSLGLSVLFTGTGEAEEAANRTRPIAASADNARWMMRDEGLTAPPPVTGPQIDTALEAPPANSIPSGPLVDDLDEDEDAEF